MNESPTTELETLEATSPADESIDAVAAPAQAIAHSAGASPKPAPSTAIARLMPALPVVLQVPRVLTPAISRPQPAAPPTSTTAATAPPETIKPVDIAHAAPEVPTIVTVANAASDTAIATDAPAATPAPVAPTIAAPADPAAPAPSPTPQSQPRNPRIIALMNQKGGVGKTTSAANLGAALALAGKRVLMIDLDPQAHLTLHFGLDPDALEHTMYDLLTDAANVDAVLVRVTDNLAVLPAEVNLAGVEAELAPKTVTGSAQRMLKHKVQPLLAASHGGIPAEAHGLPFVGFDYVIIDCPPSLGLLTINALTFANEVIVPMQAHFLALQGLSKLLETVGLIRQSFNPALTVAGVILCMHEGQTILAQEIMADLRSFLEQARGTDAPWCDAQVYEPPVRRNIKLAECPSFGQTIFDYAPASHGAEDYRALALAVARQHAATPAG